MGSIYQLDGRVPLHQAAAYGLQHVLAMFVTNITPVVIICGAAGLAPDIRAVLIRNCMLVAGLATLIQLYPVWRIGSRLPIVMGLSCTFIGLAISIAQSQGMGVLMGAVIVGGVIEGLLGLCSSLWQRFIPPVVAGCVVTGIGISLLGIGAEAFVGGAGASDFGAMPHWIVGTVTLVACVAVQVCPVRRLRSLSVLGGLVVGYVVALCMGMVNLSAVGESEILSIPRFMPFVPEFRLDAIIAVLCVYLVSATETIGDTSALCSGALGRSATAREMGGSVTADGFSSAIGGLFGCTPITSYSQNVGLNTLTKVVNRFTIAFGALFIMACAFFPVAGVVLSSIPQAVLGGCSVMMFGGIVYAGIEMLSRCGFGLRNMVIVSVSISVGIGFTSNPAIFAHFPSIVQIIFAGNSVAVVFVVAVLLNLLIPQKSHKHQ